MSQFSDYELAHNGNEEALLSGFRQIGDPNWLLLHVGHRVHDELRKSTEVRTKEKEIRQKIKQSFRVNTSMLARLLGLYPLSINDLSFKVAMLDVAISKNVINLSIAHSALRILTAEWEHHLKTDRSTHKVASTDFVVDESGCRYIRFESIASLDTRLRNRSSIEVDEDSFKALVDILWGEVATGLYTIEFGKSVERLGEFFSKHDRDYNNRPLKAGDETDCNRQLIAELAEVGLARISCDFCSRIQVPEPNVGGAGWDIWENGGTSGLEFEGSLGESYPVTTLLGRPYIAFVGWEDSILRYTTPPRRSGRAKIYRRHVYCKNHHALLEADPIGFTSDDTRGHSNIRVAGRIVTDEMIKSGQINVVQDAEEGDLRAISVLIGVAQRGAGSGVEHDIERYIHWTHRAVEIAGPNTPAAPSVEFSKIVPEVQFAVGSWYANGELVKQDLERAFWLCSLASQNDRENARYKWTLGKLYYKGVGVDKDVDKAIALFREVATSEYSVLPARIAMMFMEGQFFEKDESIAREFLKIAVEKGHKGAKVRLAQMGST